MKSVVNTVGYWLALVRWRIEVFILRWNKAATDIFAQLYEENQSLRGDWERARKRCHCGRGTWQISGPAPQTSARAWNRGYRREYKNFSKWWWTLTHPAG